MTVTEEINVKNATGQTLILQHVGKGISYLDFGMTRLPRDFEGYRVKYTDHIAQKQTDGTFQIKENEGIFSLVQ